MAKVNKNKASIDDFFDIVERCLISRCDDNPYYTIGVLSGALSSLFSDLNNEVSRQEYDARIKKMLEFKTK